jgi:hypothetical protein
MFSALRQFAEGFFFLARSAGHLLIDVIAQCGFELASAALW